MLELFTFIRVQIFCLFLCIELKYRVMKEKIIELRLKGETYKSISTKLGCSKSLVSYYCGDNQKEKTLKRQRKYRAERPLAKKANTFRNKGRDFQNHKGLRKRGEVAFTFGIKELEEFMGENSRCYLTGRHINLSNSRDYHFDHIIPISKGGKSTLDNLGLATKEANMAKSDLSVEDFISLCLDVVKHNGYKVNKIK